MMQKVRSALSEMMSYYQATCYQVRGCCTAFHKEDCSAVVHKVINADKCEIHVGSEKLTFSFF